MMFTITNSMTQAESKNVELLSSIKQLQLLFDNQKRRRFIESLND